ncbi:hypothetical protein Bbelb_200250 [Branchiostoma belcheri]|nr:hypothetical protein Bbelb_200250 [Branchiostoma belcheri]
MWREVVPLAVCPGTTGTADSLSDSRLSDSPTRSYSGAQKDGEGGTSIGKLVTVERDRQAVNKSWKEALRLAANRESWAALTDCLMRLSLSQVEPPVLRRNNRQACTAFDGFCLQHCERTNLPIPLAEHIRSNLEGDLTRLVTLNTWTVCKGIDGTVAAPQNLAELRLESNDIPSGAFQHLNDLDDLALGGNFQFLDGDTFWGTKSIPSILRVVGGRLGFVRTMVVHERAWSLLLHNHKTDRESPHIRRQDVSLRVSRLDIPTNTHPVMTLPGVDRGGNVIVD